MSDAGSLKGGGGVKPFFTPSLPQSSKTPSAHGTFEFSSPKQAICTFCFHFLHFCSSPTSKYHFPLNFGFPLWYFGALVAYFLQISWDNLCVNPFLVCLIGGLWGMALGLPWILVWIGMSYCSRSSFFMLEHAPTNYLVKCLNDLCTSHCEVWIVEWICACMVVIRKVWTI